MTNRERMLDYLNCTEKERKEKYSDPCSVIKDANECLDLVIQLIQEGMIKPEQSKRVFNLLNYGQINPEDDFFDKELTITNWLADNGYGPAQCALVEVYGWMDDRINTNNRHPSELKNRICSLYSRYYSRAKKEKYAQMVMTTQDAGVQKEIGDWYNNGRYGFPEDKKIAQTYYEKAARNGASDVWASLGELYLEQKMYQKALDAMLKPIIWRDGKVEVIADLRSELIRNNLYEIVVTSPVTVTDEQVRAIKQLAIYYAEEDGDTYWQSRILDFEERYGKFSAAVLNQLKQEKRREELALEEQARKRAELMRKQMQLQKRIDTNEESDIVKVGKAYNYFNKNRKAYDDYNRLCEQKRFYDNKKPSKAMGCGIAAAIVFVGMQIIPLILGLIMDVFGAILGVLICIIAAIAAYVMMNNQEEQNLINKQYQLDKDLKEADKKITQYYRDYPGQCPVHISYSHPGTLEYLYSLMKSGRADTVKEAINLMEEELHRFRMENHQQQILYRTTQAANAATASAFLSAVDLISRR